VDDSAFRVEALSDPRRTQRADLLAYNQRTVDARSLADDVLHEDPSNVSANETMEYLEFRLGRPDEARKWYEKAVKLDSRSYRAHNYYGSSPRAEAQ
jgi:Tfp pilus assembly protein PilF